MFFYDALRFERFFLDIKNHPRYSGLTALIYELNDKCTSRVLEKAAKLQLIRILRVVRAERRGLPMIARRRFATDVQSHLPIVVQAARYFKMPVM